MESKTTQELLAEAWALQTTPMTGDVHVVMTHAFACHSDGSDCDGGSTCTGRLRLLNMLEVALDIASHDEKATLDTFVAYWMAHREVS